MLLLYIINCQRSFKTSAVQKRPLCSFLFELSLYSVWHHFYFSHSRLVFGPLTCCKTKSNCISKWKTGRAALTLQYSVRLCVCHSSRGFDCRQLINHETEQLYQLLVTEPPLTDYISLRQGQENWLLIYYKGNQAVKNRGFPNEYLWHVKGIIVISFFFFFFFKPQYVCRSQKLKVGRWNCLLIG